MSAKSGAKREIVDRHGVSYSSKAQEGQTPLASLLPNMAWGIFLHFEKQRSYVREFLEHPVKHALETNFYLGEPS